MLCADAYRAMENYKESQRVALEVHRLLFRLNFWTGQDGSHPPRLLFAIR